MTEIIVTPSPAITVTVNPAATPYTPPTEVEVLEGQPGPQGIPGPTGPGVTNQQILDVIVPAVSYKHTQNAASTVWTINHNLHFFPNVLSFDSAGNIAEGSIVHTDINSLTITFSAPISGYAALS
jgi:hypothetical protein